jgi:hypothetical protein
MLALLVGLSSVCSAIHAHASAQAIPMPARGLRHAGPLIIALIYVSCASAPRNARTSIFGLFTVPTRYHPYAVVLLNLVQSGPREATHALAGALVGHLWWYVSWIRIRARGLGSKQRTTTGGACTRRARSRAGSARPGGSGASSRTARRGRRRTAYMCRRPAIAAPRPSSATTGVEGIGSAEPPPADAMWARGVWSAAACCDEYTVLMRYGM